MRLGGSWDESCLVLCAPVCGWKGEKEGTVFGLSSGSSSSRNFSLPECDLPAQRLEWRTRVTHMVQWYRAASGPGTCEAAAIIHSSEAAFWLNIAQFSIPYVQSISSMSVFLASLSFLSFQSKKKKKSENKNSQTPTYHTQIFCFWHPFHFLLNNWHILTCRDSTALLCFWLMQVPSFLGLNPITLYRVLC